MDILLLGIGLSNNALNQFMIKYAIPHDYLNLDDVVCYDYKLVIKGPGLYYDSDVIKRFIELQVEIITDIEFVYWLLNKDYIAVTGTNGKTSTTLLITEIINKEHQAIACGNCGFPIAQAALDYKLFKFFVLELSSFQLKGVKKFTPKIAVITNVKIAHQDYHKGIEDYYKSKYNITKNQTKNDYLVLNSDDEMTMTLFKNSDATKYTFSITNKQATAYYYKKGFYFNKKLIFKESKKHSFSNMNKYNILASIIVSKLLNIENKNIVKAIKKHKFPMYRLEEVYNGIYNDAKSTNIYSTINAIKEFSKPIILICGGYDRKEDLTPLVEYIHLVKEVYVYGEVSEKLQNFFKKNKIFVEMHINLKDATLNALNNRKDDIILFSPMFASYDQYKSYLERGKEFNKIINNFYF